jgi:hypothetical protein
MQDLEILNKAACREKEKKNDVNATRCPDLNEASGGRLKGKRSEWSRKRTT